MLSARTLQRPAIGVSARATVEEVVRSARAAIDAGATRESRRDLEVVLVTDDGVPVAVVDTALNGERHDFLFERTALRRGRGLAMALHREGIERGAVEAIFVDHHLGAGELAEFGDVIAVLQLLLRYRLLVFFESS